MEILNFVGGEFVPAESQSTFTKLSPFDGKELAQVSASDAMDFIKCLQIAKKTATQFKTSTWEERSEFLEKMAQHLESHRLEIAHQEATHQGLSAKFTAEVSVDFSVDILRKIAADLKSYTVKNEMPAPVGVVGILSAWACSLKLVMERLAPAVAAGNVVIVKVSEFSPITSKIIGDAVKASGLPPGVVQILNGGSEVAELIAGHPGIRAITATGKNSTMESIAKAGVAQLKKLQLSGAVKNSCLVLADADFEKDMALILRSFLVGQGQMCWNTSRLFIPESVAPAFMEKAKSFIDELKPLKDPEGEEMWTPLISGQHVTQVQKNISEGIQEHGKRIAGGEVLSQEGFFVRPTLMLDLPQCSVLQQDEVSGSLILVTPVKYQHEAVKWANTSYLGHSAAVWGSPEKAVKVAGQLEVAHVEINSWINSQTPTILGQKQSSFGNPDMAWNGSFYSDVKKLAGA